MLIVAYDITNDKLRTQFATFLSKFGYRLQYSIFQIKNSQRILEHVVIEIEGKYEKQFSENDSVMIFNLSKQCKIHRFGYEEHEDDDCIIL